MSMEEGLGVMDIKDYSLSDLVSLFKQDILQQPQNSIFNAKKDIFKAVNNGDLIGLYDLFSTLFGFMNQISSSVDLSQQELDMLHMGGELHSLAYYLESVLTLQQYNRLCQEINSDTILFIHRFLRLGQAFRGFLRKTPQRARFVISKYILTKYYPKYFIAGHLAFNQTIPLIITIKPWSFVEEIRCELGLPSSSVRVTPDPESVRQLLNEVHPTQFRPFMMVIGSQKDELLDNNLEEYIQIANEHGIWIHFEGDAVLARGGNREMSEPCKILDRVDSFHLNGANLLQKNSMNYPTVFYKANKTVKPFETAVLPDIGLQETVICQIPVEHGPLALPLWFLLKHYGKDKLRKKMTTAITLSESLAENLESLNCIEGGMRGYHFYSFFFKSQTYSSDIETNNLINKEISKLIMSHHPIGRLFESFEFDDRVIVKLNSFYENVNSSTKENLNNLCSFLKSELDVIERTLGFRRQFMDEVAKIPGSRIVKSEEASNLGCLRFVPPDFDIGRSSQVIENEVTTLNRNIFERISKSFDIFHEGADIQGKYCIVVGRVNENFDEEVLHQIVSVLRNTTQEISKTFQYTESIDNILLEAKKQAEMLLKEEEERISNNKGIVRSIPLVGSVWNWFSPVDETVSGGQYDIRLDEVQKRKKN
eukprot:TRINITY_DN12005_c0_g1_i1.p1 TRINITY_DN12005_c0_g1~~TRINITY_DN12005_c0_g1_i1.p1  ORF type:complete len:651 (-),score=144.18 TRINITY_DN12005_c0_g1_i1:35-1987(-)